MPQLRVNKTLVTTLSDCVSRSAFLAARVTFLLVSVIHYMLSVIDLFVFQPSKQFNFP
ncbi:hypothetical protein J6590_084904 [Homalodisca vitripennis]|nr:hypothetical protein J6590_084904 [Homalodisca vitripennis]